MAGFSIGINALRTATYLVDLAGDNIANANTPGYHVRRAELAPLAGPMSGRIQRGLGVTVEDVSRLRNVVIERSLLDHLPVEGMLREQSEALAQLESLFAEPSGSGLGAQLSRFFDSLSELSAAPGDVVLRRQAVENARAVCNTLNGLNQGIQNIQTNLAESAGTVVNSINELTARIAKLNGQVQQARAAGRAAPDLEDARDKLISDLAELVNVSVHGSDYGVVNVSCSGTLLVSGVHSTSLRLEQEDGRLSVTVEGSIGYAIDVRGGRLGGILDLADRTMPGYADALDGIANTLRRSVNLIHTAGLGLGGRFEHLAAANAFSGDTPFYQLGYGVPAGTAEKLYVNVEDKSTGDVSQYVLTLDTTAGVDQFLADLRDAVNAGVPHLTATLSAGQLSLDAEDGYAFGFATPYDPNPAAPGDITAAVPTSPTLLDAFTGEGDLQYDCTFLNGGQVGLDPITVQVSVREPAGPVLRTFTGQFDADYTPGSAVSLENGLKLALSDGNVAAGDSFSFTARASMDTAGVLDALGMNVLFNGLGAAGIHVADRVLSDPSNLACSMRDAEGDNHRLLEMAGLRTAKVSADGTASLSQLYETLVGQVATEHSAASVERDDEQYVLKELMNRRDSVSGVSVDEEMIRILQGRTLYEGALRYVQALREMLDSLTRVL